VFESEHVLERLPEKIDRLAGHLRRISGHEHVGGVRQCGLIAGVELIADRTTATPYNWRERRGWAVCRHAREQGVLLRPLGDVIVILPPLAISLDEIDRIAAAVESGIFIVTGDRIVPNDRFAHGI
jgi:adenosylmethionine---8-amino-7-oxononanoate aminotransferase